MAFEPGGAAKDEGTEFERDCACQEAFRVLAGQAVSVALQRPGSLGRGIDLEIALPGSGTEPTGRRELWSCKAFNGSTGRWSIADLVRRGVLAAARLHLDSDPANEFVFCSPDAAPILRELGDRARKFRGSPRGFAESLLDSGSDIRIDLGRVLEAWTSTPRSEVDDLLRGAATEDGAAELSPSFERLARLRCKQSLWGEDLARLNQERALSIAKGKGAEIVATIRDLLVERRHLHVHADEIRSRLRERGYVLIDLSRETVAPAIERLRRAFAAALSDRLIAGTLAPRAEIVEVLSWFDADAAPALCILAGEGGAGKSAVALGVHRALEERGVPVLPIRLDVHRPESTLSALSTDLLELPAGSPVRCLAQAAGERRCLLLIDQLDAVRWTAQHAPAALEVCRDLFDEATRFPNVRVLAVVRSYELDADPGLRAAVARVPGEPKRISVGRFDRSAVVSILQTEGVEPGLLGESDWKLLSEPHLLAVWVDLHREGLTQLPVVGRSALYRKYWDCRVPQRLAGLGIAAVDAERGLAELVRYVMLRDEPTAPMDCVGAGFRQAFLSSGCFRAEAGRIHFPHQAHVDFLIARELAKEIRLGRKSLLDWVRGHGQDLFHRRQLRLLLEVLRENQDAAYLETLRECFEEPGVRFHLRQLVLTHLRHCAEPRDNELDLILALLTGPSGRFVREQTLLGSVPWFDRLDARGYVAELLSTARQGARSEALDLLRRVAAERPSRVEQILAPLWAKGSAVERRELVDALASDVRRDTAVTFRWRFEVTSHDADFAGVQLRFLRADAVAAATPSRLLQLAAAFIDCCLLQAAEGGPNQLGQELAQFLHSRADLQLVSRQQREEVEIAVLARPISALRLLLPRLALLDAFVSREQESEGVPGPTNGLTLPAPHRFFLSDVRRSVFRLAALAASACLRQRTIPFARFLSAVEPALESKALRERFLASCFLLSGFHRPDDIVDWLLQDVSRLELSRSPGFDEDIAVELVRRVAERCSSSRVRRLEVAIFRYYEAWEKETVREAVGRLSSWRADRRGYLDGGGGDPITVDGRRPWNRWGLQQWKLLSAFPRDRLSGLGSARLRLWEGKFGQPSTVDRKVRVGRVHSSLEDETRKLSDAAWLGAISGEPRRRKKCRWRPPTPEGRRGGLIDNSPPMIASALAAVAELEPDRFARLGLRIPLTSPPVYFAWLLRGIGMGGSRKKPEGWTPAARENLEALFQHVEHIDDEEVCKSLCSVVSERAGDEWSDSTLRRVANIVIHGPTSPHDYHADQPLTRGLNIARGSATYCLAKLLWARPERLVQMRDAVEACVRDADAGVRAWSLEVCSAVAAADPDLALKLFLLAADHEDDRVLQPRLVTPLLSAFCPSRPAELEALLARMVTSEEVEVAVLGAEAVTYFARTRRAYTALAEACEHGTVPQRRGFARALPGVLLARKGGSEKACEDLEVLFTDEESEVQAEAVSFFGREGALDSPFGPRLSEAAARAVPRAFWQEFRGSRHRSNRNGKLDAYGVAVSLVAVHAAKEDTRWPGGWHGLEDVLLELYDESEKGSSLRETCLDAWDALLERGSFWYQRHLDRFD